MLHLLTSDHPAFLPLWKTLAHLKAVPFTSKVTLEKDDYEMLAGAAKKYVTQEKEKSVLKKSLRIKDFENFLKECRKLLRNSRNIKE